MIAGSLFLAACLAVAGWSAFRLLRRRTVFRLGRDGAAYAPAALATAMDHSDYPLQALLYAVVLQRFLRSRQTG